MKMIFVALCFACFASLLVPLQAWPAGVKLTWDPNDPAPEGYRIFQRPDGGVYDYSVPAWQGPGVLGEITYDDPIAVTLPPPTDITAIWDKRASAITLRWEQPTATASRTDFWVVRAYEGALESLDSEEVTWTSVATSPANIIRWDLFYSETAGGPYTPFDSIEAATGVLQTTKPITVVPPGDTKTLYFTAVAFGENGEFSVNADEAAVVIDRTLPPPPSGVSVTAVIPVE